MKEINELKKWGKIYHVNKIQKKTGLTILNTKWISETKNISRNKKDYFIIIKRYRITILNICASIREFQTTQKTQNRQIHRYNQ